MPSFLDLLFAFILQISLHLLVYLVSFLFLYLLCLCIIFLLSTPISFLRYFMYAGVLMRGMLA